MVGGFPNIFLEDLLRFPLDKEIKFCINLVRGAQLVSITPYIIAPIELTELRKQLDELFENGLMKKVLHLKELNSICQES